MDTSICLEDRAVVEMVWDPVTDEAGVRVTLMQDGAPVASLGMTVDVASTFASWVMQCIERHGVFVESAARKAK